MQFDLFQGKAQAFESLDEALAAIHALEDDPLVAEGTRIVTHRGNPDAKLMIVGEAPGAQEDRSGQPFTGPSGKLLDQILRSVKLDPIEDVFITNAVFRLPRGTDGVRQVRKPTPEEIDFYKPYLLEIIRLVDPRIVLLTGAVSMRAVLNETKRGITKMRGEWHQQIVENEAGEHIRWIMPIFHPAYLLRNDARTTGSPKALMWEDIQAVRAKFDELGLGGEEMVGDE